MTACCVPFCERTTRRAVEQFICATHWREVERRTRRLYRRVDRKFQAMVELGDIPAAISASRVKRRVWERAKAQAIQGAVGI